MNSRANFVFSIALLGLLCLMLPGSVRADTVYTYTGNPYALCTGTYASSGHTCAAPYALTLTFDTTLMGAQLDNLTYGGTGSNITADVSTFSFTDGSGLAITQGKGYTEAFFIGTDATGHITTWGIEVFGIDPVTGNNVGAGTLNVPNNITDQSDYFPPLGLVNEGFNTGNPGVWAPPVTTPEPSSYLLLGTGLLGLLALAAQSKRHGRVAKRYRDEFLVTGIEAQK